MVVRVMKQKYRLKSNLKDLLKLLKKQKKQDNYDFWAILTSQYTAQYLR
jgi:hypothetical protein